MEDLYHRPETFRTYLKEIYTDITQLNKLRKIVARKLSKGYICAKTIPSGSRGIEKIYFDIIKEYFIVFTKNNCYYCSNINTGKERIKLINVYRLDINKWVYTKQIYIDISKVIVCF